MPFVNREYSDLNLFLNPHPVTGDVTRLTGVDAVKRSIRNLILTDYYERPWQPGLGSGVTQALFEPINLALRHQLQTSIEDVLRHYEPRATILQAAVKLHPDYNQLVVTIVFEVINVPEPVTIDVFLQRVR